MMKFQDIFKALSISDLFLIVSVGREQNIQRHKNSSKLQPADRTSSQNRHPYTHIHDHSFSWFGTGTSSVYGSKLSLLVERSGNESSFQVVICVMNTLF